jgi:hypothetical protein
MKPTCEPVFVSESDFRQAYLGGLRSLIGGPARTDRGVAALVVANVVNDPAARSALGSEVNGLLQALGSDAGDGDRTSVDRVLWAKILESGSDPPAPPRTRDLGPWRLTHNPFRNLRPRRLARESFQGIRRSFDEKGFHFNRSELVAQAFRERSQDDGRPAVSIFYNKFPFAPAHTILVPKRLDCREQFLLRDAFDWVWDLVRTLEIPGFGVGYNALGAFSSVNHLHFQTFINPDKLPVMDPAWAHNGGDRRYPIPCARLTTRETAWAWIAHQHQSRRPYNLIFDRTGVWAIARLHQSICAHLVWSSGFAWYELAGCFILDTVQAMQALTEADIEKELRRLAP